MQPFQILSYVWTTVMCLAHQRDGLISELVCMRIYNYKVEMFKEHAQKP